MNRNGADEAAPNADDCCSQCHRTTLMANSVTCRPEPGQVLGSAQCGYRPVAGALPADEIGFNLAAISATNYTRRNGARCDGEGPTRAAQTAHVMASDSSSRKIGRRLSSGCVRHYGEARPTSLGRTESNAVSQQICCVLHDEEPQAEPIRPTFIGPLKRPEDR